MNVVINWKRYESQNSRSSSYDISVFVQYYIFVFIKQQTEKPTSKRVFQYESHIRSYLRVSSYTMVAKAYTVAHSLGRTLGALLVMPARE